ncbi:MAG: B12-binding domain-containing radical SAM protein, partial [Bryobacteraceae bacterium]
MLVFLGDLGHNQLTLSSDVYPLGVADLAAYATAYLKGGHKIDVRLFREPGDLKAALDSELPDILGLSGYSWNHQLSRHFAGYARARHPRLLTLIGGPNYPLVPAVAEDFLRGLPEFDVAVRGPTYEGERAFLNLVQRFADCGGRRERVFEEAIPGNHWIHPRTGEFVRGPDLDRIVNLDEIPSPYLSGWMDSYFSTGYFPFLQINRGCPFTCSFCNSAVTSNNRVYAHSLEYVKADLQYIAERCDGSSPLCFADDNFGMYPLDEEVADFVAGLQERFGWPSYIRTTTGKNRGERIIKVMRKLHGRLPMTAAVQSMNPQVLVNIKRSNISLSTYAEIQKEVLAQGMQSYGEVILCLPGETKESFLQGIRDLLTTGVKRVSAHQLMLLHGAPLADPDSRQRFAFQTRYRIVARNIGDYTGEPVIETEEMVVSTPTFSFQDYLEVRVCHLLLTIFYYEGNLEEAFRFAESNGLSSFDVVRSLQQRLPMAPPKFRRVIEEFVRESQEELFPDERACIEWARAHFSGLLSGELGGNLLSKYSMIGRFYVAQEGLDFLHETVREVLEQQQRHFDSVALQDIFGFLRAMLVHVPFVSTVDLQTEGSLSFDVGAWSADGYTKPLEEYRFPEPRSFRAAMNPQKRAVLRQR